MNPYSKNWREKRKKKCLDCSVLVHGTSTRCSKCSAVYYRKGVIPVSAFKKGYVKSEESKKKFSLAMRGKKMPKWTEEHRRNMSLAISGEKNYGWKGENITYRTLHNWVSKWLGKPNTCKHCGTTKAKRFDWANISGEYKRNLEDWIRLCRSCHMIMDKGK